MSDPAETTCWTMIAAAADGGPRERELFAQRYQPVIAAYLAARWRGRPLLLQHLDDAVQDIFVECYRRDGALSRVSREAPGGFRAFLFGVVRNVALRWEARLSAGARREAADGQLDAREHPGDPLSQVFDRAWAQSIMRQAAERQAERAADLGAEALRRVELLRLRFQDNRPIREIAALWELDPVHVHRQYALARREFRRALVEVLGFYEADGAQLDAECARLLALLA